MEKVKTVEDIEIEIRRAIQILKALPKEGPRQYRVSWPVYIMDEANAATDSVTARFYRPMLSELEDMDLVFENWLKVLPFDERVLVFKRNSGQSWKHLSRYYKNSRSWLSVKYRRCLKKIFDHVIACQDKLEAK